MIGTVNNIAGAPRRRVDAAIELGSHLCIEALVVVVRVGGVDVVFRHLVVVVVEAFCSSRHQNLLLENPKSGTLPPLPCLLLHLGGFRASPHSQGTLVVCSSRTTHVHA